MSDAILRVSTRQDPINITEALRSLAIGETIRFPTGTKYGSLRTLATVNGIKVRLRVLDSGAIEVTRRGGAPKIKAIKAASPKATQDKLYDL